MPEDWSDPEGRSIRLAVTVLPARGTETDAPLYHLSGGPGSSSGFPILVYTGSLPWPAMQGATRLREGRRIVLVDHRGTGSSNPLHCPELPSFGSLDTLFPLDAVAACRDRLQRHADLTQYGAPQAVHDLEAVRSALGDEQLHLRGGSYGSHLALAYLRQYPERVRSAVLQGILPLDNRVPLEHARNADRVFDLVVAECSTDDACSAAFPDLGRRWRHALEGLPVVDRAAGELPRGVLVELLRSTLGFYAEQRHLPRRLDAVARGDLAELRSIAEQSRSSDFALGLYLSAQCPHTLDAEGHVLETAGTALGAYRIERQLAACEIWPRVALPQGWKEPVEVDVPVLLVSGAFDHETPPEWGDRVASRLPRSRHVVAPNLGHVPYDAGACYWEVLASFYRDPDPIGVDTSCLSAIEPLPFELSPMDRME
ncbi:MAG: alpha/beta fold hydrolase [Acidobacteria bacterium]|nr:MAG: alpha/beta fold hydrolase [Acidobacteriota bacterium]REK03336.1 MAG: alpha/beta fold hydrolase [Acidobacteriota bacterium]